MKYNHPIIQIEVPAPGHYVIRGHNPASVEIPDEGRLVPHQECYIAPEVPNEALLAVLQDRGGIPLTDDGPEMTTLTSENESLRKQVEALEEKLTTPDAPDALELIRAEIPFDLTAETPAEIAGAIRSVVDRNDSLRRRVEELEGEDEELRAAAKGKKAIEKLAGQMYDAYSEAVGGKAFNGDPLPLWAEFRADEQKTRQSDAWVAAARAAVGGKN